MNKNDQQKMKQYLATGQGNLLHRPDMDLLQVLDKAEKITDNSFLHEYDKQETKLYLTKRGN